MLIRFWGVRGSISAPGAQTIRYGGNTPCLQVESEAGEMFVLDAGYGVVGLGQQLVATRGAQNLTIHLVLTHLHWDHIQGLPFFAPIYVSGNRLVIHSLSAVTARRAMELLFTSVYSPIQGVENLSAAIDYEEIREGYTLSGIVLRPFILEHSMPTLGFRMEEGTAVVCHATDHEGGRPGADAPLIEAARGASLLIHDAQFKAGEYAQYRGWGHSHTGAAVDNALAAGVHRLALSHYDPTHTDGDVDAELAYAQRRAEDQPLEIIAAAEGLTIRVR